MTPGQILIGIGLMLFVFCAIADALPGPRQKSPAVPAAVAAALVLVGAALLFIGC